MRAPAAGRDDGEEGAAPSKKHAEDGKPVEEYDPDAEQVSGHVWLCCQLVLVCACAVLLSRTLKLYRRVSQTRFSLCRTCPRAPPLPPSPPR